MLFCFCSWISFSTGVPNIGSNTSFLRCFCLSFSAFFSSFAARFWSFLASPFFLSFKVAACCGVTGLDSASLESLLLSGLLVRPVGFLESAFLSADECFFSGSAGFLCNSLDLRWSFRSADFRLCETSCEVRLTMSSVFSDARFDRSDRLLRRATPSSSFAIASLLEEGDLFRG
jgi:hypothetical protein